MSTMQSSFVQIRLRPTSAEASTLKSDVSPFRRSLFFGRSAMPYLCVETIAFRDFEKGTVAEVEVFAERCTIQQLELHWLAKRDASTRRLYLACTFGTGAH